MSGHSKWAKIHRQKAVTDQQRGKIFTKLGRAITVAVKEGGGVADPDMNFKLRLAIDKARQANMPGTNIQKAVASAAGPGADSNWEYITYEGYGPVNTAVLVEVVTDNRNRALSEIKQIFDKSGGRLGQAGSVNYLFDRVGQILIETAKTTDDQILQIMEIPGVTDLEQQPEGLEITTEPTQLKSVQEKITTGFKLPVSEAEIIMKPKISRQVNDDESTKVQQFIDKLEDSDEVQNVWSDVEIVN